MQRQTHTHTARIFPIDKGGGGVGRAETETYNRGHEREDSNHFAHKPLPLFFLTLHDELPWLFLGCTHPSSAPFSFFFFFSLGLKKPTAIYILVTP